MINLEKRLATWILSKKNVGFHGTSLETLTNLIEQGRFDPPLSFSIVKERLKKVVSKKGEQKLDTEIITEESFTQRGAYEIAKVYAYSKALHDFLIDQGYGEVLKRYNEHHTTLFQADGSIDRRELNDLCVCASELGYIASELKKMINIGTKRKGAILGITGTLFRRSTLDDYEIGDFDLTLPKENGEKPPTRYIGSIYIPTTQEKREFLDSLN
tara:strand:+ start:301 stop:942 length:642 start_codon:yes stop_codon:yes gene_type:complete